ncbi:MAG: CubicO group peptidase (beta-lactamase class C family) [Kiritimatiellia bacterium]|jgi:CubicO group peptidase (beta-lactamase class C family)
MFTHVFRLLIQDPLMNRTLIIFALCFAGIAAPRATELPQGTPESAGVSSQALLDFIEAVERDVHSLHSYVLLRQGKILSEGWWAPYAPEKPHMLYSLSKSFTSTAIGMAIGEGTLKLDDKVVSFFPDRVPENASTHLMNMRIRDLLCMGSGHHNDTLPAMKDGTETDWIKVFLTQPVEHEPGTYFRYNTGATYMLSAILQKVTGEKLIDYLTPRLFTPLGITGMTWETSAQGINTGGYGLKVTTHDIAKLGQLYLQKGLWEGKRILSEAWVSEASSKHISNGDNPKSDWNQGYGFQFWRCKNNAFRGDGAFGQYCVVLPDQDAVLAITSGLGNMQQVMDLIWKHLLPAMKDAPLPPAPELQIQLSEKVRTLHLTPIAGEQENTGGLDPIAKVYVFQDNDKGLRTMSLRNYKVGAYLVIENAHGEQLVPCGLGEWKPGKITFEKQLTQPVGGTNGAQSISSSGAWTAPDRYVARLCFDETPFLLTMTLQFKGQQLFLNLESNVAFGQKKWQLTGQIQQPGSDEPEGSTPDPAE